MTRPVTDSDRSLPAAPFLQVPGVGAERYSVRCFIDDQNRLLPDHAPWPGVIVRPDGRLLLVDARRCRSRLGAAPRGFARRYGRRLGAARIERFALVVDFLEEHRSELVRAGLVAEGDPPAVREEFLQFLLDCRTGPNALRLPPVLIRRFHDEWGHRR